MGRPLQSRTKDDATVPSSPPLTSPQLHRPWFLIGAVVPPYLTHIHTDKNIHAHTYPRAVHPFRPPRPSFAPSFLTLLTRHQRLKIQLLASSRLFLPASVLSPAPLVSLDRVVSRANQESRFFSASADSLAGFPITRPRCESPRPSLYRRIDK